MDLSVGRPVIFRGYDFNTVTVEPGQTIGKGVSGCQLDSVDMSEVDVVQFMEKRSQQDGMDVGVPFLGARRVRMAGTAYGATRALLYDELQRLRRTLSPTLSSREAPADYGYQPLYYSEPTNDIDNYPELAISKRILVLPHSFSLVIQKDQTGGSDGDSLAQAWQAILIMRDPTITSEETVDVAFTATNTTTAGITATASTDLINKTAHGFAAGDRIYFTALTGGAGLVVGTNYYVLASGLTSNAFKVSLTNGGSAINITSDASAMTYVKVVPMTGNFVNRGDYHAPLNMLFSVTAAGGIITVAAGDSNFTLTIPASSGTRIIRYKGVDKIVTAEEASVEDLKMSYISFQNNSTNPLIPGGTSPYTVTFSGGIIVLTGSHMWFWETYA